MLTKTTITALRTLVHIGLSPAGELLSIRHIAEHLGESPTYLAKVARQLVRAGLLKAHRGVAGGIELNRPARAITLRAIVEACQGAILADFCQETRTLKGTCAFHVAAAELHQATVEVLSRWTLDQFVERPGPSMHVKANQSVPCLVEARPSSPAPARGKPASPLAAPAESKRGRSRRVGG